MHTLAGRRARSRKSFLRNHRLSFESLEKRELLSATPPTVTDVAVSSTDWSTDFVDYVNTSSLDDIGYSIPTGSSAQTLPLPWNNINQIKLTFSEDVNIDAADFSLSGVNTTNYSVSNFLYDAFNHVATWTLDNNIAADRLMIDLDADGLDPIEDLDGNILDGEWTDDVTSGPSGNGTAGGDFEFSFNVLPGDVDQTQFVNIFDYIHTRVKTGQDTTGPNYSAFHDIDGSGLIDSADWLGIIGLQGTATPAGQPVGATSDAPTTAGIGLVDIDDPAIDVAISLFDAFEDAEDTDSQLTYAITENTDPSLLDTLSINTTTGELTISSDSSAGSGRTTVTLQATDSQGLSVETDFAIDVNRDNQPPEIEFNLPVEYPGNVWLISGQVTDPDDNVEGFIITFWGVYDIRASVDENGEFQFAIGLDGDDYGELWARTHDPHGARSQAPDPWVWIEVT